MNGNLARISLSLFQKLPEGGVVWRSVECWSSTVGHAACTVNHTYVPPSPGRIIWYWSKGDDILQLGR